MNETSSLTLEDIMRFNGPVVLEFGASWCSHCQAAQTIISDALLQYPNVKRIKIEDGKGKRLGRQFSVKLWPTVQNQNLNLSQRLACLLIPRQMNGGAVLLELHVKSRDAQLQHCVHEKLQVASVQKQRLHQYCGQQD
jgi:thioredoxin 1